MPHYRSTSAGIALCALLLALAPTAQADPFLIEYSVLNYGVTSAGPFTLEGDTVTLSSFTYSSYMLDGEMGAYAIGYLNFNVDTSPNAANETFNVNRQITINGVSAMLLQDLTLNIWHYDTASVTGDVTLAGIASTTTIDLGGGKYVDVTPIAFSKDNNGTYSSDAIYANFFLYTIPPPTGNDISVPEPTSLSLLAIGALGMFGASRKRKQDKA